MASTDAAVSEAGMAAYAQARGSIPGARRVRGGGRGGGDRVQPRAARPHPGSAPQDALGRPAPPHRARPHPVLGCRHDDPRRADQPPRCGQRRLAARVPEDLRRRRHRDQPRRRPDRGRRQQGVLPRCQPPGHRHLQHGLEALPPPARGRRGPPQEGALQRREEGDDAAAAGGTIRGEGLEGGRRPSDGRARREDAGGARRRARRRPGRQAALPGSGGVRADSAERVRPVEELRLPRDLHGGRPGDRSRIEGRRAGAERRGQDDAAPHPGRRRQARHGPGRARVTACASATTRRSTRRSTSPARCSRT